MSRELIEPLVENLLSESLKANGTLYVNLADPEIHLRSTQGVR